MLASTAKACLTSASVCARRSSRNHALLRISKVGCSGEHPRCCSLVPAPLGETSTPLPSPDQSGPPAFFLAGGHTLSNSHGHRSEQQAPAAAPRVRHGVVPRHCASCAAGGSRRARRARCGAPSGPGPGRWGQGRAGLHCAVRRPTHGGCCTAGGCAASGGWSWQSMRTTPAGAQRHRHWPRQSDRLAAKGAGCMSKQDAGRAWGHVASAWKLEYQHPPNWRRPNERLPAACPVCC